MKKMTSHICLHGRSPQSRLTPLSFLLAGTCLASPLSGQFAFKADNTESLNSPASWVDEIVPNSALIAVWDDRVSGFNSVALGSDLAWRGIQILNPNGGVSISGNTLVVGAGGIDLSAATNDLQISSTLDFFESQKLSVGAGRNLNFNEITRRGAVGLEFEVGDGGAIRYGGFNATWLENDFIVAGSQAYATYNGVDFAALEDVWPNSRILAGSDVRPDLYRPNPDDGIPNETIFLYDYVNTTGAGARATGNRIVHNHRFNQPNPNAAEWFVNTGDAGRTITISSILVTENVGPQNVRFGGPGWIRVSNASGGLQVFQNNTAGDLILSPGRSLSAQSGTRTFSKHGPGTVIVEAFADHGGATVVFEGILRFTQTLNSPNHGVTVDDGGILDVAGATLNVAGVTVREGGAMTGRGNVTGPLTNFGELVTDLDGNTLRFEGDVVNYGTITVLDGAHLEILGSFTNFGTLDYSGGFASLPEGFVNEGTIVAGQDGPPPPINVGTTIADFSMDEETGQMVVSVDSRLGVIYHLERSMSLREPAAAPTRITADADTTLGNDGNKGPDFNYGVSAGIDVRNFFGVREQVALFRFDVSSLTEDNLLDQAQLDLYFGSSNRTREFEVWAVDESLDGWIESGEGGVTYNNFDGFLPAPLGFKEVNQDLMTLLGRFTVEGSSGLVNSTDPTSVNLGDFIASSTNGLISLVVFMFHAEDATPDDAATYTILSKENAAVGSINPLTGVQVIAPTLTVPTAASVAEESSEPWQRVSPQRSGSGETLIFTDTPGDRDRVFYRILADLE
jgi:hypothetical protein